MNDQLSRVIVKGGVLSPGELKTILEAAEGFGLKTVAFGSRQDILFEGEIPEEELESQKFKTVTSAMNRVENIVSSYVSSDLFPNTPWLTADRYLYILEQFENTPRLKINIVDPRQRLVPLFTAHLNFIASEFDDYWYLYLRLPHWESMQEYPVLIYSWDLARVAQVIENLLQEEPETVSMVFDLVIDAVDLNSRTVDKPLQVDFRPFPYYEGMNRMAGDRYWLGLYWRNNKYDIRFLKELCDLCADSKIGKISLTPFKSFIVKGIPAEAKLKWEKFLGMSGINVRHSMLELNWHVPVANTNALKLKNYLVDAFNASDISTYGLTFGITDFTRRVAYFTSIVIERNATASLEGINIPPTFNIVYARDFDPNTRDYIVYALDIDRVKLPELLMELSRMYFENLGILKNPVTAEKPEVATTKITVHQCSLCQTIYDSNYGDATQGIAPGTLFTDLPEDYSCSLCEGNKENYTAVSHYKAVT
ncbi:rubredoxin [Leeuwenhoekiella aestuarii]|uniref:Rubredoxin n=1 Tax=Leeuwenhoekiella aestuarii TaxID=2249426 RepID=A0A4Q0NTR6_9FLAO|nr:rubredoxin [Leeuwenhoekiella aestuarii]RXG14286.1 rubredoxin [Leeuwenhoekiella aestuarii]RXG19035.1 rubredoxin [Leeuwenhoekiella aestuarii]